MTDPHSADQPPEDQSPAVSATEPPSDAAEAQEEDAFALDLPKFQGPLELLLHLIERHELDITEVSLLAVAEQYLAYVRAGDRIDLGALAAFISTGARLLLLKSRALLPPEPVDGDDDAEDHDPQGLLDALVEYRRYRRAAEHLRGLEDERRSAYRREAAPPEMPPASGLDGINTDQLYALFREVLERLPAEEPQPELAREPVLLRDRVSLLTERLDRERTVSFRELIGAATSRLVVIVDFLAVLDLIRRGYLEARQDGAFGEITLARVEGASPQAALQASLPAVEEPGDG